MFGLSPSEITLIISALQWAITEGKALYDAEQLQSMADLLAKLQAQAAEVQKDRTTANADIDARDKALEDELKK